MSCYEFGIDAYAKNKVNRGGFYLLAMALNSYGYDAVHHDYDVGLDSDTLDCCYSLEYLHLEQMSVAHGHVPNPMDIYS